MRRECPFWTKIAQNLATLGLWTDFRPKRRLPPRPKIAKIDKMLAKARFLPISAIFAQNRRNARKTRFSTVLSENRQNAR